MSVVFSIAVVYLSRFIEVNNNEGNLILYQSAQIEKTSRRLMSVASLFCSGFQSPY